MLKLRQIRLPLNRGKQPPSGGCVLKLHRLKFKNRRFLQPPSGGCVLKLLTLSTPAPKDGAATFGWLCVETFDKTIAHLGEQTQPPSGGCVLKHSL